MKRALALLLPLAVVACQDTQQPTSPTAAPEAATVSAEQSAAAAGRYIVVFKADVADAPGLARSLVAANGGQLRFAYERAIKGFAVHDLPAGALEALSRHPNVAYVEPDAEARLFVTQTGATWGIDRIDQVNLPLSTTYSYNSTGNNVNAYILDTGVRLSHNDFGGRAAYIPNGKNGDFVNDGHGSAADCHGHGTHVAGTVGGSTYGVAKNVKIWAGRVVNCSGGGNVSMAIAAVDWITANAAKPAVVNMSLGYGNVQSLRDAVENSIKAGVNYAVAAGNGNFFGIPLDACSESPAGAPNANTVGATDKTDKEASFSNYGKCVDILAPGVSVVSDYYTSDSATATMSGTSMATPHVAGVIALYLQSNTTATPAAVSSWLKNNGSSGKITLHSRSKRNKTPNLLLYTTGL